MAPLGEAGGLSEMLPQENLLVGQPVKQPAQRDVAGAAAHNLHLPKDPPQLRLVFNSGADPENNCHSSDFPKRPHSSSGSRQQYFFLVLLKYSPQKFSLKKSVL
jgi:hypothetical protein